MPTTKTKSLFIPARKMQDLFITILKQEGFDADKAENCAHIFVQNSLEGIYSHGVNRFARFVRHCRKNYIDPQATPTLIDAHGAIEQWNGNLGPGPLNARMATNRAMQLADDFGIGLATLANTNHWMRGGAYGLQAAEKGYAFIGWTNTMANLPPWGSRENKLGNNPIVFSVPFKDRPILLDMAVSQYSFGKLKVARANDESLPQVGGYDENGQLSTDPSAILESRRALPIGFWKGAGLSLLLDILACLLSSGLSTSQISQNGREEYGVSQVFICMNLKKLSNYPSIEATLEQIIADYQSAELISEEQAIRYPGQNRPEIRAKNEENGIPVHPSIWDEILAL